MSKILNDITESVGNTPIVRLGKIAQGIDAEILGKLESFNPAGSVKDRIGFYMIKTAEEKGILKGIVNFGQLNVKQVMRSRVDITAFEKDNSKLLFTQPDSGHLNPYGSLLVLDMILSEIEQIEKSQIG